MVDGPSNLSYAPDLDGLTAGALELIWNAYPGYSADVLDKDEVASFVRRNFELAVAVLRRGRQPTYAELAEGRSLGTRRATLGVPLESVIQAFRSTERILILDLFSGARRWPADLIGRYADLAITTFDLLTDETINSYREASSAIEVLDEAADVLVVQRFRRRLANALQPVVSGSVLVGELGEQIVVLAAPRRTVEDIADVIARTIGGFAPQTTFIAGLGEVAAALTAAHESCVQAQAAVRVAARQARRQPLVHYDSVLLDVLVSSSPRIAERFASSRLGPLAGHPHLLDTLRALGEANFSQSEAARREYVHVNTISHRLKRIGELTGRNPLQIDEFIEFVLALRCAEFTSQTGGPVGKQ